MSLTRILRQPRAGASGALEPARSRPGTAPTPLDRAILRTVTYASLFQFPMSLAELERGLMDVPAGGEDVCRRLDQPFLRERLVVWNGLVHPRGRQHWVDLRRLRREHTRALVARHASILGLIARFPFVRLLALSGGCAHDNASDDDVDLFLVTREGRAWSVCLALMLLAKLRRPAPQPVPQLRRRRGGHGTARARPLHGRRDRRHEAARGAPGLPSASSKPTPGWRRASRTSSPASGVRPSRSPSCAQRAGSSALLDLGPAQLARSLVARSCSAPTCGVGPVAGPASGSRPHTLKLHTRRPCARALLAAFAAAAGPRGAPALRGTSGEPGPGRARAAGKHRVARLVLLVLRGAAGAAPVRPLLRGGGTLLRDPRRRPSPAARGAAARDPAVPGAVPARAARRGLARRARAAGRAARPSARGASGGSVRAASERRSRWRPPCSGRGPGACSRSAPAAAGRRCGLLERGHRVAAVDVNLDARRRPRGRRPAAAPSPTDLPRAEADMEALPLEPGASTSCSPRASLHYTPRALAHARRAAAGDAARRACCSCSTRRSTGGAATARRWWPSACSAHARRYGMCRPAREPVGLLRARRAARDCSRTAGWRLEVHGWPRAAARAARDAAGARCATAGARRASRSCSRGAMAERDGARSAAAAAFDRAGRADVRPRRSARTRSGLVFRHVFQERLRRCSRRARACSTSAAAPARTRCSWPSRGVRVHGLDAGAGDDRARARARPGARLRRDAAALRACARRRTCGRGPGEQRFDGALLELRRPELRRPRRRRTRARARAAARRAAGLSA